MRTKIFLFLIILFSAFLFSCESEIEEYEIPSTRQALSFYQVKFTSYPEYVTPPELEYELVEYTNEEGDLTTGVTVSGVPDADFIIIPDYLNVEGINYPVVEIDNNAFNSKPVKILAIPPTIKKIGVKAFENTNVEKLYIKDLKAWCNIYFVYKSETGNTFTQLKSWANPINQSTKVILNGEELTDLIIPEGVTEIKHFAFANLNCNTILLNDNLNSIYSNAFEGCTANKIIFGKSKTELNDYCFYKMDNLSDIVFNEVPDQIALDIFTNVENMSSTIKNIFIPSSNDFIATKFLVNFYFYNATTPFGYYNLFTLDGNPIEDMAIENVEKLYYYALAGARIKSLKIGEGLKLIYNFALYYMPLLERIELPASFEILYDDFNHCENLKEIRLHALLPPTLGASYLDYPSLPENLKDRCTLYVPAESIELYRNAPFWSSFINILPLD